MKASNTYMMYLLGKNYLRSVLRSRFMRSHPVLIFCLTLVVTGFATILFFAGKQFGTAVRTVYSLDEPVILLNDYLIPIFVTLFAVRFLFQRTPRFNFRPYLHLPVSKTTLVHFFQGTSLLSLHTFFPLVFLIPFWMHYVSGSVALPEALLWLMSVVALLIMSSLLNNWLRAALAHRRRVISTFSILLVLFVTMDQLTAAFWVNDLSRFVFESLLTGDLILFSLICLSTLLVFILSSRSLLYSMRISSTDRAYNRKLISESRLLQDRGILVELMSTELRLMWRNRRPRHYLIMSVLFSTAYLLFLLASHNMYDGIIFGGIIGLFASGGFALNYGQLMFAWESSYYDGLLARNIDARTIIVSKYMMLQASCVVLFLASLPMFILLRPDLLGIHVAFLFYNAGVTSTLIMMLALRNRRRVDVGRTGSFFNYEGFSAAHWIWIFPTALPPILAIIALRSSPAAGTLAVVAMGVAGLATWRIWTNSLGNEFYKNRHEMAAGFRTV